MNSPPEGYAPPAAGIFTYAAYPENTISGCFGASEIHANLVWDYCTAVANGEESRALRMLEELVDRGVMVPVENGLTFKTYKLAEREEP